jgi:hypothetical protein
VIAEPQAVGFESLRRRQPLDPKPGQMVAELRQIILECAEAQVVQFFAWPLVQHTPSMRVAVRVKRQQIAFRTGIQSE